MPSTIVDWMSPATTFWLPVGIVPDSADALRRVVGIDGEQNGSLYEASFLLTRDIEGQGTRLGMVPWIVTDQNLMFSPAEVGALVEARPRERPTSMIG